MNRYTNHHVARTSAVPLRSFWQRALVIVLMAASIGLLQLERNEHGFSTGVRATVTEGLMPVLDILSRPVATFHAATARIGQIWNMDVENRALRRDNAELLRWQEVAKSLATENASLRELLNYHPQHQFSYTTARIIGHVGGAYAHTLAINTGKDDGVELNQAVIADAGLVGRVVEVNRRSAKVQLLSDLNFRVPVRGERSGAKAMLAGTNGELPQLMFASRDHDFVPGETLVTSFDGEVFPAGIHVGSLVRNDSEGMFVKPSLDAGHLDYVKVVQVRRTDNTAQPKATDATIR